MDDLRALVEILERQDFHRILTCGLPEEISGQIRAASIKYLSATPEDRKALRSIIRFRATSKMLIFVGDMATLALQQKEKGALDLGLAALDLSNVIQFDRRNASGPAAQLVFAAKQSNVDMVERAKELIPEMSPVLEEILMHPRPPRLTQDDAGTLAFHNPWVKSSPEDTSKK